MNSKLSTVPSSATVIPNLHILLERNSQGSAMIATVLEFPNCNVEAPTREQISALRRIPSTHPSSRRKSRSAPRT